MEQAHMLAVRNMTSVKEKKCTRVLSLIKNYNIMKGVNQIFNALLYILCIIVLTINYVYGHKCR